MVSASSTKPNRIAVGLTGLVALLFFSIALFAFFESTQSKQELASYKEQHRLLIEEYQDLSLQVEQLRTAHQSIETLLQQNRKQLSQSEQARIKLEKKKFQDQLEAIEEKQNYIRLRQKLWTSMRQRLAQEIESSKISLLKQEDLFIIRIPNDFLFVPASVRIQSGTPIETATPIEDPDNATIIENPEVAEDEASLPLPSESEPQSDGYPVEIIPSPAESLLNKVALILNHELPDIPVLIEGHTDNVPIGPALREQFPSNWELSSARATAAVRYLQQVGEVSPSRMTAIGRADTTPISQNHPDKGNKENRRVDIIIKLDEQSLSTLFSPPSTSSPADTVSQILTPTSNQTIP
ncbi:MAG: OmpA family protein [Verrucomicrobiota bacterium]